jgi:hypothetical protein
LAQGSLYKLKSTGIDDTVLKWFERYLSNRRQQVVINGETSDTKYINAGDPQGSILGPMLFLIYINDIVNNISCNVKLFADDTSLYLVVDNEYEAADKLNKDVYMDNVIIKEVETHKHLGLTISEDGNWNEHVKNIMIKVSSHLSVFRRVKFKLKRSCLQTIYISFIKPLMKYSDIVWDNIPDYLKQSLESLQLEAARIVTGATKLTSRQLLYDETGLEMLQTRRNNHKLIKFHEMFHKDAPDYLNSLVPPQISETHQHNTRRSNNTVYLNCRTFYYQNSFLPASIKLWNNSPNDIRLNSSKCCFE